MLSSLSLLQRQSKILLELAAFAYGTNENEQDGKGGPQSVGSAAPPFGTHHRHQFAAAFSPPQFVFPPTAVASPPASSNLHDIIEVVDNDDDNEGKQQQQLPTDQEENVLSAVDTNGNDGHVADDGEHQQPIEKQQNVVQPPTGVCGAETRNPPISAIEPNSSGGASPAGGGAGRAQQGDDRLRQGRSHDQLSPAASITAEVQRVSIDDRAPSAERHSKKSSPEAGRLERAGRALRKHAAVEDEEHFVLAPCSEQSTCQQGPLVVPALHLPQPSPLGVLPPPSSSGGSLPSVSPLLSAEQQQLASFAAAAAVVARPSPQHVGTSSSSLPQPTAQHLDPTAAAIQLAILQQCQLQQQQQQMAPAVKHEPLSREELLSTLVQQHANREQLLGQSWLNQAAAVPPTMGLLNALIQQQQAAESAATTSREPLLIEAAAATTTGLRLAAIQEEQNPQQPTVGAADIQRLFEAGRNHSTESTASTSGGSLTGTGTLSGEQIPRKQDIQTDIRMNRGRFQLVRKRGRSEVWNLFGQVIDTLTGARLPYVACYACKVLYTDTGGGTGNMTRHRCSMGSSYRSSSDTTVGNESLSFESIGGGAAPSLGALGHSAGSSSFGATSPPYCGGDPVQPLAAPQPTFLLGTGGQVVQQQRQASLELQKAQWGANAGAREVFAMHSHSSGFLSAGSTTSAGSSSLPMASASSTSMDSSSTPHYQHLSLSLGPPSAPLISRLFGGGGSAPASSCTAVSPSTGGLAHQPPTSHAQPQPLGAQHHALGLLAALSPTPGTAAAAPAPSASAPSSLLARPQALAAGHHFTQADKQLFAQAVMQFCAQDLHNWDVVEGEGFKNLVETILFIGRRSHGDPSANSYDPVRQLIPTAKQLKQVFLTQERAVLHATTRDLDQVKGVGLALNCQTLEFGGERHWAISANYITDDWRITRRTLRVEKATNSNGNPRQLGPLLAEILAEFHLSETAPVLLSLDSNLEETIELGELPANLKPLANAKWALNQILAQSLAECPDAAQVSAFVRLCARAIGALCALDRAGRWPEAELLARRLGGEKGVEMTAMDFTNGVYPALKFVKEKSAEILTLLDAEESPESAELAQGLRNINWQVATELELFLEPFHETAQIFADSKQPHFQRILPEWFALMHECQPGQRSIDESAGTSSTVSEEPMGMETTATAQTTSISGTPSWIRAVRQSANERLKLWADGNIRAEHRAATVLNPRLRHLPLICSDGERTGVYERIRELVGLSKPKREASADPEGGGSGKNEPFKKRRRFLDRLEDCAMEEEDELDTYLRSTFAPNQTRDILDFWSSLGETHFPRLARLARFLLATSGAPAPIGVEQPSAGRLGPGEIGTLLNLRPDVLNSVNHQLAHHRAQQQRQQKPPIVEPHQQQQQQPME